MKLAMIGLGKMIGGEADIVAQLTPIFDMRHQFAVLAKDFGRGYVKRISIGFAFFCRLDVCLLLLAN